MVEARQHGKTKAEVMREYDLSKSTEQVGEGDKPVGLAARGRQPHARKQNRIIELERENRRLRMEVDVLKQAALIFATKVTVMRRRRRTTGIGAMRDPALRAPRPTTRCARGQSEEGPIP